MATSGANVKMGVSGVAQFKQSINQAKNSIKTLDAQLALTEKQFKANGDAEEYLQKKTEQLQSKMEAQRSVIENTEKALSDMRTRGVDMNSKAFQDMVQQLARANSDLLDTQMQMQGVESAADNSAAAVTDMASELSSIGSQVSFQTVIQGLDSIADGLQHAATKAFEMGKALFMATLDSAAWADEINTAATKAGMTTQEYQQMAAAAEQVDTSIDSIIGSQQKLAQAAEKDNDAMDAIFARLGVQKQRYGEVRDLNDLFWETGEALMKIENEADQADMGKKLFGQWRELIPMFQMGREEYEKLRDSQTYVDEKHMKALQSLDDSYKDMQHQIDVLKQNFFAELAPSIETVTKAVSGLVQKFNEYLQTPKGQAMMESLADNIEKLFSSITNFDPEEAIKKVGDVMGAIQQGFEWISDNWESVQTGLIAIAGGWLAIKTATIGLKIAELVTGLKGLPIFGGGSGGAGSAGANAVTRGSGVAEASATGVSGSGFFGKLFGGAKALVASGLLETAGIAGLAVAPALLKNAADDRRVEEKRLSRLASASMMNPGVDRDFLERASNALGLYWHGGNEAEVESILMGMKDRSDLQKAQLQAMLNGYTANGYSTWDMLQKIWSGEPVDMGQMNATLESVTDAYQKMSEQSEELKGSTDNSTKASADMTAAAEGMMDLPKLIESAVIAGMSNVKFYIDGQQAGNVLAPYVDGAMGGFLAETRG